MAETEGVALNQFINVAVAEKLSALRTEGYFRERADRGDVRKAKRILQRPGVSRILCKRPGILCSVRFLINEKAA